jgi:D-cysteine desulfhydrase family pyridoxal phosphate-dependent enzyme
VILSQNNTPVHPWKIQGLPCDFRLWIKRDDMTGGALMGNKVRKLEFLFAEAKQEGADAVITCGGTQSNHCRATAVAAKELGMKPYLLLRSNSDSPDDADLSGNLLLDLLVDSTVIFVPKGSPYSTQLLPRMRWLAEELKKQGRHKNVYLIPVGGSNPLGMWGYIDAYREMMEQGALSNITDIVVALGSGGTACGLALASHLSGLGVKVHGVTVSDHEKYFHSHCNEMLCELGVSDVRSEDILDIIVGYKGKGYGKTTDEELQMSLGIARDTGILLDPTYTLKATRGMLEEMKKSPSRFAGRHVLFVHTGGLYGMLDGTMAGAVSQQVSKQKQMMSFFNLDKPPQI